MSTNAAIYDYEQQADIYTFADYKRGSAVSEFVAALPYAFDGIKLRASIKRDRIIDLLPDSLVDTKAFRDRLQIAGAHARKGTGIAARASGRGVKAAGSWTAETYGYAPGTYRRLTATPIAWMTDAEGAQHVERAKFREAMAFEKAEALEHRSAPEGDIKRERILIERRAQAWKEWENAVALRRQAVSDLARNRRNRCLYPAGIAGVGIAGAGIFESLTNTTPLSADLILAAGITGAVFATGGFGFGLIGRRLGSVTAEVIETAAATILPGDAPQISKDFLEEALSRAGVPALTTALQTEELKVLQHPKETNDGGWIASMLLPGDVVASQLFKSECKEKLGKQFHVHQSRVALLNDIASGNPGVLIIRVMGENQVKEQSSSPITLTERFNIFERFAYGESVSGELVHVSARANYLFAGASQTGKTTNMRALLAWVMLDPRSESIMLDYSNKDSYRIQAPLLSQYVNTVRREDKQKGIEALKFFRKQQEVRGELKSRLGGGMNVDDELANNEGLHPLYLFIDEFHELFDDPEFGAEAKQIYNLIVRNCIGFNMYIEIGTQAINANLLPNDAADQIKMRVVGQLGSMTTSNQAIPGASTRKLDASQLPATPGTVILDDHRNATQMNVFFLDDETIKAVTARELAMRGGEVVPRNFITSEVTKCGEEAAADEFLEAVDSIIRDDERNIWVTQIVSRLKDRYPGITEARVRSTFADIYNIEQKGVWNQCYGALKPSRDAEEHCDVTTPCPTHNCKGYPIQIITHIVAKQRKGETV